MFSVLNVYKPLGLTSHDVVARLRKVYQLKKIGHLGTLDPLAEGVLPVCLGKATRLIEYFPSDKKYLAQITLGISTTTLDREGDITQTLTCEAITEAQIQEALLAFVGVIDQKVPLHSAVHVDGKKLYKYAQSGHFEVETPTKKVTIHSITLQNIEGLGTPHPVVELLVHCGTGTYIRSLARDLGIALGSCAHLSGLIRTQHGRFDSTTAVPLETLQESATPEHYLQNPALFLALPILEITSETAIAALRNGVKVPVEEISPKHFKGNTVCYLKEQADVPVAVAQIVDKAFKPLKVFL